MRCGDGYARWTASTPNLFGAVPDSLPATTNEPRPLASGAPARWQRPRSLTVAALSLLLIAFVATASSAQAAEYDDALAAFRKGEYAAALKSAEGATAANYADVRWWRLRLDCLATLGRYAEGTAALDIALRQHYADGALRLAGYELLRGTGENELAKATLAELLRIAAGSPWRFHAAEDRVYLGRAATLMGADAREVLEGFFDQAQKQDPELRSAFIAVGELALAKHDDAVAAESFRKGLEKHADDADLLCGLARATAEESRKESAALIEKALGINPKHLASLFVQAEDALSYEDYRAAREALTKILAVNPRHPRAWSLAAVLAHLQADPFGEPLCRAVALSTWSKNPAVDHVIGAKLSKAYRFVEGAAHQRAALEFDPEYLPARAQLAQDLLRLGDDDEGWRLVEEVQQADEYDVVAYNLATLREKLKQYVTLESPDFRLHMDRREAAVYGPRVLSLLERARETLEKKYGWKQPKPVNVEILTRQSDFAIRTFGQPGGDGILGVCFGTVITANSPAALAGNTTNWEATLWHEYCHVVTLEMTQHRLPRWLSEGISVYEERQADPTWGNRLNRELRQMILEGELARVSQLNQAFRNPKSAEHFNLAYYQASLVVEYLVDTLGQTALRRVLDDVARGMPINDSLELRTGSLHGFEKAFDTYARKIAASYGPDVDWNDDDLPAIPQGPASSIAAWLKERPQHYRGRLRYARALIEGDDFAEAAKVLEGLTKDVPEWAGDESPYALLARAHRELKDTTAERKTLEASAARSDDALETYRRLIELAVADKDFAALAKYTERYLAVDPLSEFPYRSLAEQGEQIKDAKAAVGAARSLVALEPADRAGAHFLLAKLLHNSNDPEAKRHALLALEETPRFRDAQRLLLTIVDQEKPKPAPATRQPTKVAP